MPTLGGQGSRSRRLPTTSLQPHAKLLGTVRWLPQGGGSGFLLDIYAAGEAPLSGIDSQTLARAMKQQGCPQVEHSGDLMQTATRLKTTLKDGDLRSPWAPDPSLSSGHAAMSETLKPRCIRDHVALAPSPTIKSAAPPLLGRA